jgi:hypothetical protein
MIEGPESLNGWKRASDDLDRWVKTHYIQRWLRDEAIVWISPKMRDREILMGPLSTSSGYLPEGHAVVHPDINKPVRPGMVSLGVIPTPKEQHMAHDPKRKEFTTTRVEWWVPTKAYPEAGASWTELTKALHWAHQELREAGVLASQLGDAADDQITIHPHDEHVIVRIKIDKEKK